ncbi:MAG: Molybdenum-containing formylmethanofuran dehydrogenase 1 subunit C [Methanosaeta sp. PtaU1.Bin060]|nr:MAG: Molybdenum-containing formylmethanofuran dehydrogenase 1 subunit C [Methanosaeta sp. PtaU1.Bin060]
MRSIVIAPRNVFCISVEAENISPDRFAPLKIEEIKKLIVWQGNRQKILSDLFTVDGEDSPSKAEDMAIRLSGDFSNVKRIGEGMTSGAIEVQGSAGMHAGNHMSGGILSIAGNADDWLAREMLGGRVVVMGDAGNYVGAGYRGEKCGMRGGEIEVRGNAGAYLGEHLCGGSIRVGGNAGDFPGAANQGGTIFIGGSTYLPGAEMSKGTINVRGETKVLPSFQKMEIAQIDGTDYQKYLGDLLENGKGELFVGVAVP